MRNTSHSAAIGFWIIPIAFEAWTLGIEKNIDLKIRHTYRVCDNVSRIAKSLEMGRDDLLLAEVLALFHDIGRFEQLKVFGSFDDRITVDHAKLGLKVLNSSGVFA